MTKCKKQITQSITAKYFTYTRSRREKSERMHVKRDCLFCRADGESSPIWLFYSIMRQRWRYLPSHNHTLFLFIHWKQSRLISLCVAGHSNNKYPNFNRKSFDFDFSGSNWIELRNFVALANIRHGFWPNIIMHFLINVIRDFAQFRSCDIKEVKFWTGCRATS